ncbi:hypothetical protein L915_06870, partial [Phytophthora nicotianae]
SSSQHISCGCFAATASAIVVFGWLNQGRCGTRCRIER